MGLMGVEKIKDTGFLRGQGPKAVFKQDTQKSNHTYPEVDQRMRRRGKGLGERFLTW